MDKLYAGVGSREGFSHIQGLNIAKVPTKLSRLGFKLRSGGARGLDKIFELNHDGPMEIITAKETIPPMAYDIDKEFVKGDWDSFGPYVQSLMARNSLIFLGRDLITHVAFSVLWSPATLMDYGGSAMGMRLCEGYGIPYFNLRDPKNYEHLQIFLRANYETVDFNFGPK